MKELIDSVVNYYEIFFTKVSGNKAYQFTPKPSQLKQIQNFLKLIDKEIGLSSIDDGFLFDFLSFQFERKKDQKTRFGKGIIPLNNVIGQKAYDRWVRKSDNWAYWVGVFLKNYSITKPITVINADSDLTKLRDSEERIKNLFLFTDELFIHCYQNTTLHNSNSKFCKSCKFAEECKELQKNIYPKIYEARKIKM